MTPPQNARSALSARRAPPVHTRSSKPPPLMNKRTSFAAPSKKSPTSKAGPGWSKTAGKSEPMVDPEGDDMDALPQFCTTCEKQIVTPGHSILYCSESCRKKDHNKPLHESVLPPETPSQPPSRRTSYFGEDSLHSEASPSWSPMAIRPPSIACSDSSESSIYDARSPFTRNESEAAHYLSQFRPVESACDNIPHAPTHERSRPSTSYSVAPSLSHTPTSIMTSGSYMSMRPLPRRSNPFSASFSSFSVDLITPIIHIDPSTAPSSPHCRDASVSSTGSTNTAFHTVDGEMKYDKQPYVSDASMSQGSLRQLFSHDAIKAPPKSPAKVTFG